MESNALMTKLTAQTDEIVDLRVKLSTSDAKITSLNGDVTSRDETITALTAENTTLKEKAGEAETAIALAASVKDYVGKQYVALKALDGDTEATAPDDIAEAITYIDANSARLSALIPAGGASSAAGGDDDETKTAAKLSATQERNRMASFRSPK